ncbi:hypothetical protein [Staphylococcus cohnii]
MKKALYYVYSNVSLIFSFILYFISTVILFTLYITINDTQNDALQVIKSDISLFLTYIIIFLILGILLIVFTGPFLNIDISKKRIYFKLEEHRVFLYIRFFIEYLILLANMFYFIINVVLLFYSLTESTVHIYFWIDLFIILFTTFLVLFYQIVTFVKHYILIAKDASKEKLNNEIDITMAVISITSILITSGFEINKFVSKGLSKPINTQLDFTDLFIILTPILLIMYTLKLFIIFREQIINFIKDFMR